MMNLPELRNDLEPYFKKHKIYGFILLIQDTDSNGAAISWGVNCDINEVLADHRAEIIYELGVEATEKFTLPAQETN